MKQLVSVLIVTLASLTILSTSFSQIWPPEGLNMPGSYDGFANPPTVNAIAGIQKIGGTFLLDTLLQTRRYHTVINVASLGGDITNGTYTWLFTSGPSPSGFFNNKWSNVNVIIDSVQTYTKEGVTNNSVTVADSFYTVNFQDNGYANTKAIWISTATAPISYVSTSQSPLAGSVTEGTPVTVTVNMTSGKPSDQNIYVRYTTDNFATTSLAPVTMLVSPASRGTAIIPGQVGGMTVKYYSFSTKFVDPTTDVDLKTLQYINNGGANYTYSIPAPNYTITASAGPHGGIAPSGSVIVPSGGSQLFTFTPAGGYYVDSIIVDNVFKGDSGTYQFTNVTANHTIIVKFAHNVDETFRVNMGVMRHKGFFRPDLGDVVTVRGTFNDFGNSTNNPDTLIDLDNDSVYTKTVSIRANSSINYKFWKILRGGLDYEIDISNRTYNTPDTFNDTIPTAYFDNQYPDVNVTFRVNMSVQRFQGKFHPDSGDVVTVRGSFNDFGNSTNNPDTLTDLDNDSIYTKTIPIPGNQTIQYKYWKTFRDGQDYEVIPPTPFTNRSTTLTLSDKLLPVVYYNNDNASPSTMVTISKGWNILSLPRTVSDSTPSAVFPNPTSQAFGYNGSSYVIASALLHGKGYWLKFSKDTMASITGVSRLLDTVVVTAGWNLIGTISSPLLFSSLLSAPPGIISSKLFEYSGRYLISDTLVPGRGYWLKTTTSGTVILNQFASIAKHRTPAFDVSQYDKLEIRDAIGRFQTLYLHSGGDISGNVSEYELPPVLFEETFDVRFASDRFVENVPQGKTKEFPISVRGVSYPVEISWSLHSSGSKTSMIIGQKKIEIAGNGSTRISNGHAAISVVVASDRSLPGRYALQQNYPNPFNPTTLIQYELPEQSLVRFTVYNVLGERVADLIDGTQSSGFHSVNWNGTSTAGIQVSSGIYFYSIQATSSLDHNRSFTGIKKMILLR